MKRIVKIGNVSAGGVSLEVVFRGVGWLYGYEVKTPYATIGQEKDGSVRIKSQYFGTIAKAKEWLTELTDDMIAIEFTQKNKVKEFEKALCGENKIGSH